MSDTAEVDLKPLLYREILEDGKLAISVHQNVDDPLDIRAGVTATEYDSLWEGPTAIVTEDHLMELILVCAEALAFMRAERWKRGG